MHLTHVSTQNVYLCVRQGPGNYRINLRVHNHVEPQTMKMIDLCGISRFKLLIILKLVKKKEGWQGGII